MAGKRSVRTLITVLILGALAVACSPAASTAPSAASPQLATSAPSQGSSSAPSPGGSAAGIVLKRTGPIGCDTIGVDYTSAVIKIDAGSDPDVWAETDTGKKIAIAWTDGFTATDGSPPVINGPKGEEVARDGTRIVVPADANPRLAGYFVCLGVDAIYVLETDPQ